MTPEQLKEWVEALIRGDYAIAPAIPAEEEQGPPKEDEGAKE
jgi:hypothetical protein